MKNPRLQDFFIFVINFQYFEKNILNIKLLDTELGMWYNPYENKKEKYYG